MLSSLNREFVADAAAEFLTKFSSISTAAAAIFSFPFSHE